MIVVFVIVVAVFVVPKLFKKGAPAAPAATARRTAKTDTSVAAKPGGKARAAAPAAPATAGKGGGKAAKAGRGGKGGKAAAAPAAVPAEEAPSVARDTTPLAWGGDPFVRDWLMAGELRDLNLRAVTLGEKPLALINDRIVAPGDTISGKRVAAIMRDSVVLEFGGQRFGLKIGE